jgi:hypothetical protein
MKVDERTIHTNWQEILDAEFTPALNYAINYTKAGLRLSGHDLAHWRHPDAKRIRNNSKAFNKSYNN